MDQQTYQARKQDPSLKLFVVMSKAHRTIMDLVAEDIKRYKLNTTEFAVLELLFHEGEQPLQKIGEKILLASGSITYVVGKLHEKGYLERKPCSEDRRITYARISDKGVQLLNEIFPEHWKRIEEITAGLAVEEKKVAIDLLKQLGTYAENMK